MTEKFLLPQCTEQDYRIFPSPSGREMPPVFTSAEFHTSLIRKCLELDLNCNALLQKDPQMQWPVYDRNLVLSHIEVQKTLSQNWQADVPQYPRGP